MVIWVSGNPALLIGKPLNSILAAIYHALEQLGLNVNLGKFKTLLFDTQKKLHVCKGKCSISGQITALLKMKSLMNTIIVG